VFNQQWAGSSGPGVGPGYPGSGQWAAGDGSSPGVSPGYGPGARVENVDGRKRTRVNAAGQLVWDDEGTLGSVGPNQSAPGSSSDTPVTFGQLSQMAERFMNQQKLAYKNTKALLEQADKVKDA